MPNRLTLEDLFFVMSEAKRHGCLICTPKGCSAYYVCDKVCEIRREKNSFLRYKDGLRVNCHDLELDKNCETCLFRFKCLTE